MLGSEVVVKARTLTTRKQAIGAGTLASRLKVLGHIRERVSADAVRRAMKRGQPEGLVYKSVDKRQ